MIKNIFLIVSLLALGYPAIAAESRIAQPTARSSAGLNQQNNERTDGEKTKSPGFECDARRNPEVECREFAEQSKRQKSGQSANQIYSRP